MTYTIQNFTHASSMRVLVQPGTDDLPPLIILSAFNGPFALTHGMTPEQAREMAQALWDCAAAVDGQ